MGLQMENKRDVRRDDDGVVATVFRMVLQSVNGMALNTVVHLALRMA